jgi:hypothetical protein
MRVAVVGGGLFGCTAAVALARAGHAVTLIERHTEILHGATRANCGRLHRGYHYPRSEATARATMVAADQFAAAFPSAVYGGARHHYLIASGGLTSGEQYLAFLGRLGLPYQIVSPPLAHRGAVDAVIRAPELLVHPGRLRSALREQLRNARVQLQFGTGGGPDMAGYDLTVLATYGAHTTRSLQWEVTEVALVRLGQQYAGHSYVVLDGPYCCLDPLPGTDMHLLYDVEHSVHHRNVGLAPEVPEHLVPLLDRGRLYTNHTRVAAMEQTARGFLAGIGMPEYCGSLFTVRAVLPNVDGTDERPTLVERDGDTISILSGKLDTALVAAGHVVDAAERAVVAA